MPACAPRQVTPHCIPQLEPVPQMPIPPRQRATCEPRRSLSRRARRRCRSAAAGLAADSGAPGGSAFPRVVLPTALALLLCNMDRICLSVAMVPIAAEMGWPAGVQGVIQSAFLWGYLATQLLGGTLADKYGGVP